MTPSIAPSVAAAAQALDAELVTSATGTQLSSDTIVIFGFADHYISLAYDAGSQRLTVVAPGDQITVIAPSALPAMLAPH